LKKNYIVYFSSTQVYFARGKQKTIKNKQQDGD